MKSRQASKYNFKETKKEEDFDKLEEGNLSSGTS